MTDYRYQWDMYRVRTRWTVICLILEFLAFIPVVGIASVVSRKLLGTDLWYPAAIVWGLLYVFTIFRLRNFPCPRCNKNFFGGIDFDAKTAGNLFSMPTVFVGRKCAFCGLRKYANE